MPNGINNREKEQLQKKIDNMKVNWNGQEYVGYIPLPSDSQFWYNEQVSGGEDWNHLIELYDKDGNKVQSFPENLIKPRYDAGTQTYYLTVCCRSWPNDPILTVSCSKTGTVWTQGN